MVRRHGGSARCSSSGRRVSPSGAFPPYSSWVGATADGITYFVGSLFFTSAAALQFQQSADRLAWWAGLVQLVGTLFFNRSTFQALNLNLSAAEADRHVWTPDVLGSIAFLVSSAIACVDVRPRSISTGTQPGLVGGVAEHGGIGCLRHLGRGQLRDRRQRRSAQRAAGQPRHLRRGAVLPVRRCSHPADQIHRYLT